MALVACSDRASAPAATQPAVAAVVTPVVRGPVVEDVSLPGVVRGANTAVITARTGGRVTEVSVEAGNRVAESAKLVTIDPADARADVAAAKSSVTRAEVEWQQAKTDERRYRNLLKTGAVSKREYEMVRNRFDAADAALKAARQALDAARERLGYSVVRAPFAGLVTERLVDPGDMVPPGTPLMTISGGHTEVWVYAASAVYDRLTPATAVRVEVSGVEHPAHIRQLVDAADPSTHTHLVKLALADGSDVPVGAYATAIFSVGKRDALTVPAAALVQRAGIIGVLVVDSDNRAHFREVHPGARAGDSVVIAAGLAVGERVVVRPGPDIGNGSEIEAEPAQ